MPVDRHEWVAAALLRRVYRRFRTAWQDLPAPLVRRWALTLGAGALAVALLTAGLTWSGQRLAQGGWLAWEEEALRWLQDHSFLDFRTAVWIGSSGNSLFVVPLTVLAAGWAAWSYRPLRALTFIGGMVLYKLFVFQGWTMWSRARPDLVEEGLMAPGVHAFPSGHVVQAVFFYGLLAYLWGRASGSVLERALAALFVLLMVSASGFGRLRVGAHWPSDVIAGVVIGGAWLVVAVVALRSAERGAAPGAVAAAEG